MRVDRNARTVEFDATAVLDTGFLEQLVCLKETREHESLFVFEGKASEVHAALLLAGAVTGAPGRWKEVVRKVDGSEESVFSVEEVPPTGSELEISVRLPDRSVRPISWFVREAPIAPQRGVDPPSRFVFGGSRFAPDTRSGGERYVADSSGSLIGLVTFGDETIGALEVIPDQAAVAAPIWEAHSERMPRPGTKVTIVLQLRRSG